MASYKVAFRPNLGFYPNYSFEVGDITGDGRKEMAALTTDGNLVRILTLEGEVVLERRLNNYGTWGTIVPIFVDVDEDGRQELVVPDGPAGNARLIAVNAENELLLEHRFEASSHDDYEVAVPLLATFQRYREGEKVGIVVGVAGGRVYALNRHFGIIWEVDNLRPQFGHEIYIGDATGDGLDDMALVNLDHNMRGNGQVAGELLVLRGTDGRNLLRQPMGDLIDDHHFSDVVMGDIRGTGRRKVLVAKGILMDMQGQVIWDLSEELEHGQWLAIAPNPHGPGLVSFVSGLGPQGGDGKLISPLGEVLWELSPDHSTRLHPARLPGAEVLPTRPHTVFF